MKNGLIFKSEEKKRKGKKKKEQSEEKLYRSTKSIFDYERRDF